MLGQPGSTREKKKTECWWATKTTSMQPSSPSYRIMLPIHLTDQLASVEKVHIISDNARSPAFSVTRQKYLRERKEPLRRSQSMDRWGKPDSRSHIPLCSSPGRRIRSPTSYASPEKPATPALMSYYQSSPRPPKKAESTLRIPVRRISDEKNQTTMEETCANVTAELEAMVRASDERLRMPQRRSSVDEDVAEMCSQVASCSFKSSHTMNLQGLPRWNRL